MTLVDTDVLIDVIRGHAPAVSWFRSAKPLPAVSGLSIMELIQGARNRQEVTRIERLTQPLRRVWPTNAECDFALSTFSRLRLSHGVDLIDALIASIAFSRSATLYSFNSRHFTPIAGLTVTEPYVR